LLHLFFLLCGSFLLLLWLNNVAYLDRHFNIPRNYPSNVSCRASGLPRRLTGRSR
jgi:hypothetical protein